MFCELKMKIKQDNNIFKIKWEKAEISPRMRNEFLQRGQNIKEYVLVTFDIYNNHAYKIVMFPREFEKFHPLLTSTMAEEERLSSMAKILGELSYQYQRGDVGALSHILKEIAKSLIKQKQQEAKLRDEKEIGKNVDVLMSKDFPCHLPDDIIIKIAAMTATKGLHTEKSSQEIARKKLETLTANASQLFKLHTERTQSSEKQHAFDQQWGLVKK